MNLYGRELITLPFFTFKVTFLMTTKTLGYETSSNSVTMLKKGPCTYWKKNNLASLEFERHRNKFRWAITGKHSMYYAVSGCDMDLNIRFKDLPI